MSSEHNVRKYSDEEADEIRDLMKRRHGEFKKTDYYGNLNGEEQENSWFILDIFSNIMYSYHLLCPAEWDIYEMEDCCLGIMPRKVSADEETFRAVSPVLAAFFEFLGEKKVLEKAGVLAKRVRAMADDIVEEALDPESWGMAKAFGARGKEAGFDMTDPEDVQKFVTLYNEKMARIQDEEDDGGNDGGEDLFPETVKRTTPKTGRNNPCPCGSGKKYKKCCGR